MKTSKRFLMKSRLTVVVAILVVVLPSMAVAADSRPPNIIVILADDMGYGDVGCYNPDSKIPTPNMDRLAAEGIRFTDAHSADSVCTPSRYALLTGRYCWRSDLKRGVLFNYEPPLIEKGRTTIASFLRDAGYATAMVGKWHLGLGFKAKPGRQVDFDRPLPWPGGPLPDREIGESIDFTAKATGGPCDHGFDYAFYTAGCSTDQEPFCFIENGRFLGMENASYRHPAGSWRSGMAAADWVNETVDVTFTDRAIDFIDKRQAKSPEQPFFLYLALSAPHSPHLIPDFARGKSDAGVRGDMVWLVDWSVGRIMQTLAKHKIADRTLLIVTSDNGPLAGSLLPGAPERTAKISGDHSSAGPLRGYKGWIYEGGHRVPMIARLPGKIPASVTSDFPVCQIDLLKTFGSLVGKQLPDGAGEDSSDILQVLCNQTPKNLKRLPIIHHTNFGTFALREEKWKIVFGQGAHRVRPSDQRGYLFNMEVDPHETTDLWLRHPEVVEQLTEMMDKYDCE